MDGDCFLYLRKISNKKSLIINHGNESYENSSMLSRPMPDEQCGECCELREKSEECEGD